MMAVDAAGPDATIAQTYFCRNIPGSICAEIIYAIALLI